ncbi:MAG: bifunctional DNA-formamidopyrimidine glycosylase/DNA-(apurinic or apyrimidinic site) lyase [Patescibacteria group bacterium]
MPELPEVETISKGLDKKLKNKKITRIWTDWPKYFKLHKNEKDFSRQIIGKKILKVSRRGKNILFYLSEKHILLIHLKMTGHLLIGEWKQNRSEKLGEKWQGQKWVPTKDGGPLTDPFNRFIRLIFFLDNGKMLALSDVRRFAKVLCGVEEKILNLPDIKNLGPEPLDKRFTYKKFGELFKNKKGVIKSVLMDQGFISGIGNIYSDEILWLSKIHPSRRVEGLKEKELIAIYKYIKQNLKKAIRLRGTSFSDYRDSEGRRGKYSLFRRVYQREGEPCSRCGIEIKRIKIGARSAHFCPICQKE